MKKTPLLLLAALALSGLPAIARVAFAADAAVADHAAAAAAPTVATATPAPPAAEKKTHKLRITITADDKPAPGKAKVTASAKTDKGTDNDADVDNADAATPAGSDHAVVGIGHDSTLPAGGHAQSVVAVLGSATSAGQVDDAVVSVVGDTRVTGPVGDSAVAVLGNTYVDSHVGDGVVAVFGNVELGPHAEVGGDVVAIGGELIRDPAAVVHGQIQNVALFGRMGGFEWLHPWIHHCLLLGRPLAFAPGLGWAWSLACIYLGLYLLIALLFPKGVNQCVQTMETHPGRAVLAAIFTFIGKPIVFLLLVVTVIGMALVPFLAFALFLAGLFGKAVVFAWMGRRVLPARHDAREVNPVLAVLAGGAIALLLYVVPFIGFIAYKALDILGMGIVVYTLILAVRARRAAKAPPAGAPPAGAPPSAAMAAAAATENYAEPAVAAPPPAATAAPEATAAPAPAPAALPPVSLDHANRAGFWIRMAALLLDLILVGVVLATVHLAHHALLLFLAAYGAVMWKLRGTTIGGSICGLRIVRLDGRAVDWSTAIARALGAFLSMFVVGLGFIWVVFDSERQSWHDKIAGTVVVHVPRGTPLV
jgi:uncharacterized RDD family membrane protein YckC